MPVSSEIRMKQQNKVYDYYGAAGVIDKVDDYLFNERLLLIGEDGANLLSRAKDNAFFAEGKYWVNNHAHILDSTRKPLLDYIALYINSIALDPYITGSAQPKLNQDNLNSIPVPLPPYKEQRRIIESVEQWIEVISSLYEKQEELTDAVIKAKNKVLDLAICGKLVPQDSLDEPALALLKRINPAFEVSHNLHYEPQPLFALPRGWEWCSVKAYTKKVTDYVASGSFASLKENVRYYKRPNYALLVKTKDFANNFTKDLTYTDERGYNFLENSRLYGGELLFSNVGSVGKIFKVPKLNIRMTLAPNAIMVKFHQDDQAAWFERVFQSPFGQESLRIIASATAIMKFNKTDFGKLLIPVPPVNEQKRILKAVDTILAQLDCIYYME